MNLPHRYNVYTRMNIQKEKSMLTTARIFHSGHSQAVRLPKAYRFSGDEVVVKRFGSGVLLLPLAAPWATKPPERSP